MDVVSWSSSLYLSFYCTLSQWLSQQYSCSLSALLLFSLVPFISFYIMFPPALFLSSYFSFVASYNFMVKELLLSSIWTIVFVTNFFSFFHLTASYEGTNIKNSVSFIFPSYIFFRMCVSVIFYIIHKVNPFIQSISNTNNIIPWISKTRNCYNFGE